MQRWKRRTRHLWKTSRSSFGLKRPCLTTRATILPSFRMSSTEKLFWPCRILKSTSRVWFVSLTKRCKLCCLLVPRQRHCHNNSATKLCLLHRKFTTTKRFLFGRGYWIHLTISRSIPRGTLSYYVNDLLVHSETSVSREAILGTGTWRLGYSELEGARQFNGLITHFNVYTNVHKMKDIEEHIQQQHCCHEYYWEGDWLSWNHVITSWKLIGSARIDRGRDCTSFEGKKIILGCPCSWCNKRS